MAAPDLITLLRAVLQYPRTTGLSADTQTNTLYFGSDTVVDVDAKDIISDALDIFLAAIDGKMDNGMFTGSCVIDYFNMLDPEPREIWDTDNKVLTLGAGTSAPLEVSCCLSFEGQPASGPGKGRRKGRVYLPTFQNQWMQEDTGRVRWTPTTLVDVTTMASAFHTALLTGAVAWAVYSPTTAQETAGTLLAKAKAATTYVQQGWVDDEPDIQRRRGGPQGTKSLWT